MEDYLYNLSIYIRNANGSITYHHQLHSLLGLYTTVKMLLETKRDLIIKDKSWIKMNTIIDNKKQKFSFEEFIDYCEKLNNTWRDDYASIQTAK